MAGTRSHHTFIVMCICAAGAIQIVLQRRRNVRSTWRSVRTLKLSAPFVLVFAVRPSVISLAEDAADASPALLAEEASMGRLSSFQRYAVAGLLTVMALSLALVGQGTWGSAATYSFLLGAVMLSSWVGGLGPGSWPPCWARWPPITS